LPVGRDECIFFPGVGGLLSRPLLGDFCVGSKLSLPSISLFGEAFFPPFVSVGGSRGCPLLSGGSPSLSPLSLRRRLTRFLKSVSLSREQTFFFFLLRSRPRLFFAIVSLLFPFYRSLDELCFLFFPSDGRGTCLFLYFAHIFPNLNYFDQGDEKEDLFFFFTNLGVEPSSLLPLLPFARE